MSVLLIGLRASGKSTIGRLLAKEIDLPLVDLDTLALQCFEQDTITEVWDRNGEAAWRDAETLMLRQVLSGPDSVIALGGGVPMIDEARAMMQAAKDSGEAVVIYLKCDPRELRRRLDADRGDRPPLMGADSIDEIEVILQQREATYEALASHILDVTYQTAQQATDALARWLMG